jgi:hypothetical protein
LGEALDAFPDEEGDQREEIADRLEEYVKRRLGRPKCE